jgi:tetratricopeptide (TPR) repeat protein
MLLRPLRLALAAASLALAFAGMAFAAPADDLRDAQKLYSQGKLQPALDKVDTYLKTQPREPQGRFLKGLILTEQKKTNEAIQVFTGLTEDFPELPEPYNNLAVLYASQGNYDKAKSALELAIHTHPTYATAHENLGDIYAQLASRAYDRALQLDKNNESVQLKLSMVKDLFSSRPAAHSEAAKPAKAPAPTPEPAKTAAAEPVKPAPKAATAKVEPAKPEPAKPAPAKGTDEKKAVAAALEAWAAAWSAKDVKAYLAAYSPAFDPPGSMSREAWEQQRTERIEKPKSIEVVVKVQSITVEGDAATAVFRQSYRSDTLKSTNTKAITFEKVGGKWLIKQERITG